MQRRAMSVHGWCLLAVSFGLFSGLPALGQDTGDTPCVSLHGMADLAPPEGAENQDAVGVAYLKEVGERSAIHVLVRGLDPGATFDVRVANDETSESIGTITTRSAEAPPPRYFHARLEVPGDEEPPAGGAGEGDAAVKHGDRDDGDSPSWLDWFKRWRERHRSTEPRPPSGYASLSLNEERTELRYSIYLRGLAEAVTAASLTIGETAIDLDVESLAGRIEVTGEQVDGLVAGEASISVQAGEEILEGAVKERFSRLRQWIAEHLAGRGALRLDTSRDDVLPLGAASISDLVGAGIVVVSETDDAVLGGGVGELMERGCRWTHHHDDGGDPADGGEDGGDETVEIVENVFFEVGESHDASFVRGDANDDSSVDISDAMHVLWNVFLGGPAPYCADAADADDSGQVDITDPIAVLETVFLGRGRIAAPFPARGHDTTVDELSCEAASTTP